MRMISVLSLKAALAATLVATASFADGIEITDAYIRSGHKMSKSGAAFMVIHNDSQTDDRLTGFSSPAAKVTEVHTHIAGENGVMKMTELEDGLPVPAGGTAVLKRGGDHLMLMGLTEPLEQGEMVPMTLRFEHSGEVQIEVKVDHQR